MKKVSAAAVRQSRNISHPKLTIGLDLVIATVATACWTNPARSNGSSACVPMRKHCNQVAAPTVLRTPNMHRAKRIAPRECGWKHGDSGYSAGEKTLSNKKTKELT